MRKLPNGWMRAYRDYIVKHESPDVFHFWISAQIISAALRRNVWIDKGTYTVYSNQYVFLVAESASCRKSVAMNIGMDLLEEIDEVAIVYERATVEGLMTRMQRISILPNGRIVPDGSVFIHADELSNLFGKSPYILDLMSFLTAAYSSREKLDFTTRNKPLLKVRNPCPSILAGTTPEQLGGIFSTVALSSGFLGRVILVGGKKGRRVPNPQLDKSLVEPLIHDLKEISKLYGEMKLSESASKTYDAWYDSLPEPMGEMAPFDERRHTHVLKLALVLSASDSDNMIVELEHLNAAILAIDYLDASMRSAVRFIGQTAQASIGDRIKAHIRAKEPEPISHSVLLRRVYKHVRDSGEFQSIIDTLIATNQIEVVRGRKGIYYKVRRGE